MQSQIPTSVGHDSARRARSAALVLSAAMITGGMSAGAFGSSPACEPQWWGVAEDGPTGIGAAGALAVGDLGTGEKLFASAFQAGLFAWDGTSWEQLGLSGSNTNVRAIAVGDAGEGVRIYAGRRNPNPSGQTGVYELTPAGWSAIVTNFFIPGGPYGPNNWHLGLPKINTVRALAVFDHGGAQGSALYIGGIRRSDSDTRIYRYHGATASLQTVPGAFTGTNAGGTPGLNAPNILHMIVFDDGSGPALYASGNFTHVGGLPASNVARFDGTTWSALSAAGDGPAPEGRMFIYETDEGTVLIIGDHLWDGAELQPLGRGSGESRLIALNDGPGRGLYAVSEEATERWTGSGWEIVGPGLPSIFIYGPGHIETAAEFHGGAEAGVFVSGDIAAVDDGVDAWARLACPAQPCIGDLNGDDFVDQADLAILLAVWGSQPGDPNWNPDADINGDGQVGHADLAMLLAMYGKPCP